MRHPLVQQIIKAYDARDAARRRKASTKRDAPTAEAEPATT